MTETRKSPPLALITGGSAGLGAALTIALRDRGWDVLTDARGSDALNRMAGPGIRILCGDVTDPAHRADLVDAVERAGRLDLLVHNASTLGPTPLPALADSTAAEFSAVLATNLLAPLELTSALRPRLLAAGGIVVGISSDAAVEHYPGWGLYGSAKAALDHLILTFGVENPGLSAYAVDPGDMRTAMHQAAFPGEDISDRPLPQSVVPALLALLAQRPPSGRYRAADFAAEVAS